jgi:hypothetical protein
VTAQPTSRIWARIGGGLEAIGSGERHGPADLQIPPPAVDGEDWKPLFVSGRLVGWTDSSPTPTVARRAAEHGERLERERRGYLLGRLGHKLRSAVLSLQESARQAAFGRPELLEKLYEQAQEVGRRAAALEAAALEPKDAARSVVLAAVLNTAAPEASNSMPGEAVVRAPEPVLYEAMARAYEWMGGRGVHVTGGRVDGWWKVVLEQAPEPQPVAAFELGEPLVRLLVDVHCQGWLDSQPGRAVLWLPAV